MVETKPYLSPEVHQSKDLTDKNKGQAHKSKNYRGKKTRTKYQGPQPETQTDFKGWCSDLEGYIFDLGLRVSDKFARTMKKLERYLGSTYSNICQPSIMTETPSTFPNPDMPTIIPDTGVECPKIDVKMAYLKTNSIDEAIHQKLMNKDVY